MRGARVADLLHAKYHFLSFSQRNEPKKLAQSAVLYLTCLSQFVVCWWLTKRNSLPPWINRLGLDEIQGCKIKTVLVSILVLIWVQNLWFKFLFLFWVHFCFGSGFCSGFYVVFGYPSFGSGSCSCFADFVVEYENSEARKERVKTRNMWFCSVFGSSFCTGC